MDLQRVVKSESADSQKVEITKRHYHTISFQTRKELIFRVLEGERLREVARQLGVKLSTAKFIVRMFKEHGKVTNRRQQEASEKDKRDLNDLHLQFRKELEETSEGRSAIQQPVYYAVPMIVDGLTFWGITYQLTNQALPY